MGIKGYLARLIAATVEFAELLVRRTARLARRRKRRQLGRMRGEIWVSDDFDAPLPPDLQEAFERWEE